LIREGRSFGFGVFLSSQSVSDYDKQETDYSEFMNNVFMFRVGKATSSQLQRLIRIEKIEAERLLTEAYNLPTGECIWNTTATADKPFTRLRAIQFYQD
jgi:DNA helicase HerA-like ATPase